MVDDIENNMTKRAAPVEGWAAAAAKLLQSCPILCDPIDGSPPGSTVPGILQARTLERVAISFSNAWKWKVKVKSLSHVQPSAIPWCAAFQAPPSMGFSRQEYWSGVSLPSPRKDEKDPCFTHILLSEGPLRPSPHSIYMLHPMCYPNPYSNQPATSHAYFPLNFWCREIWDVKAVQVLLMQTYNL